MAGRPTAIRRPTRGTPSPACRARFLRAHGTGGNNVHPQNSVQLIDRVVQAHRPMQQFFHPNRTHSISGGNTTVHLHESLTRVLRENL